MMMLFKYDAWQRFIHGNASEAKRRRSVVHTDVSASTVSDVDSDPIDSDSIDEVEILARDVTSKYKKQVSRAKAGVYYVGALFLLVLFVMIHFLIVTIKETGDAHQLDLLVRDLWHAIHALRCHTVDSMLMSSTMMHHGSHAGMVSDTDTILNRLEELIQDHFDTIKETVDNIVRMDHTVQQMIFSGNYSQIEILTTMKQTINLRTGNMTNLQHLVEIGIGTSFTGSAATSDFKNLSIQANVLGWIILAASGIYILVATYVYRSTQTYSVQDQNRFMSVLIGELNRIKAKAAEENTSAKFMGSHNINKIGHNTTRSLLTKAPSLGSASISSAGSVVNQKQASRIRLDDFGRIVSPSPGSKDGALNRSVSMFNFSSNFHKPTFGPRKLLAGLNSIKNNTSVPSPRLEKRDSIIRTESMTLQSDTCSN